MDHRAISIQFLQSTGLYPVRVNKGQKAPTSDWDPRTAAFADNEALLKVLATDEFNLGALFFGRWVDVDMDSDDPNLSAALDHFLPSTKLVWGRTGKPRGHRIYTLYDEFERGPYASVLRYMKKLVIGEKEYSVEIRGGKPEAGLFAVLPGSIWPGNESNGYTPGVYEWAYEVDPSVSSSYVDIKDLVRGVRFAQVASIIANYWVEGVRNDMSLAFAGLMWRIRSASMASMGFEIESDIPDDMFIISEQDALELMDCIMMLAGDDTTDRGSRKLNFKNTWRKLENDPSARVTGGKVLSDLMGPDGESVVKAIYRLLSDNDGIEALEALAEQFVVWYGQGVLIDLEMIKRGADIPWMGREAAKASLGGRKILVGNKKVPMVNLLFDTTLIPRIAGLTFDPSTEEQLVTTPIGQMINQWRGFEMAKEMPDKYDPEIVQPFLDYIREVVADGEEEAYEWVLAWLKDMFQKPEQKPGTALVLVGVQGAGKTFLGERVLRPMIGGTHSAQTNSITMLTDKFNQIMDNKVFLQCDEAIHSYQKDVSSRLKSLITDKDMRIEPKGVNAFLKPNHLHFLFTSNEQSTAMFIDPSPYERRFTVLKVSDCRARDLEYWKGMHQWLDKGLPHLLKYLLTDPYNRSLVNRPLDTDAKRDLQRVGIDAEVSWLITRLGEGFPLSDRVHQHWFQAFNSHALTEKDKKSEVVKRDIWPDVINFHALEEDYRNYVRGMGRSIYSGNLFTTLKPIFPENSLVSIGNISVKYLDRRADKYVQTRVRLHSFPPKEALIAHLRAKYGALVDRMMQEASQSNNYEDYTPPSVDSEEEEF